MIDRSTLWAPVALALLSAGCSVFDESLIPVEDDGSMRVGDRLVCSVPVNDSRNGFRFVDLASAQNDENSQPSCVVRGLPAAEIPPAPGNDVYFRISMEENQKWHFHVKEHEGVDPLIYIADRCDDSRSCRDGINACGEGKPEHFSFVASSAGDYFVGLDSLTETSAPLEVFAVNPVCGNGGAPQHSEFCDDQNDDPLDGCHQCRRALSDGDHDDADGKNSFNDGPLDPTLLLIDEDVLENGGEFSVGGAVASDCDFDFFEFTLTAAMSVTATLSGEGDDGAACRGADLTIDQDRTRSFLVDSEASAGCPLVAGPEELEPGAHQIRVAARKTLETTGVRYTLTLTLAPPAEAP